MGACPGHQTLGCSPRTELVALPPSPTRFPCCLLPAGQVPLARENTTNDTSTQLRAKLARKLTCVAQPAMQTSQPTTLVFAGDQDRCAPSLLLNILVSSSGVAVSALVPCTSLSRPPPDCWVQRFQSPVCLRASSWQWRLLVLGSNIVGDMPL